MNEFLANPHPPLSGFPIVILTLLAGVELWSALRPRIDFTRTRNFLTICLALFATLTYLSGYWAFDEANKSFNVPEAAILRHQGYAKFFVLLVLPLLLVAGVRGAAPPERIGVIRALSLLWKGLVVGLWCLAAYVSSLGGDLVFSYGAAVRAPLPTVNGAGS